MNDEQFDWFEAKYGEGTYCKWPLEIVKDAFERDHFPTKIVTLEDGTQKLMYGIQKGDTNEYSRKNSVGENKSGREETDVPAAHGKTTEVRGRKQSIAATFRKIWNVPKLRGR